jgi:hypothetical protein
MKSIQHRMFASSASALLLISLLSAAPALAVPKEGDIAANARIEDADGHGFELKTLKGKPFVIVYDDKASAPTSDAFRRDLLKLAKSAPYRSALGVVLVGDVSPYDYWPAKGIVKDAVREETRKQGTTIYCDWTTGLRTAYRFRSGVSNVVVVGGDGRVAFASEGVPTGAGQKRFYEALRGQVESVQR